MQRKKIRLLISVIVCLCILMTSSFSIYATSENPVIIQYTSKNDFDSGVNEKKAGSVLENGMVSGPYLNVIDGMKCVAQNENTTLYFRESDTAFAVSTKDGAVWYSSPQDTQYENLALGENLTQLKSNIIVDFYTTSGTATSYDSYNYSVVRNNFTSKQIEDGIAITYTIGKQKDVTCADVPNIIYADRFEDFLSKMDEKTALDIKERYKLYSLKATKYESVREKMLKEYPTLKDGDIYVLKDKNDTLLSYIYKSLTDAGYTSQDLKSDNEAHNITETPDEQVSFTVTLSVILKNDCLSASVDCDTIKMPDSCPITSIQILPYFGCANAAGEGYMLLPDGSGGLVNLNSTSFSGDKISLKLYGQDQTLLSEEEKIDNIQCCMPVFGMKNTDQAFFGIIESGDGAASVNCTVSGKLNTYNSIWSSFLINPRDTFTAAENAAKIVAYPDEKYKGKLAIRYSFLSGEKADYQGMAESYREYLQNNGTLDSARLNNADMPFLLETIGTVDQEASFLGLFSYQKKIALTTYSQTAKLIDLLKQSGVENIVLNLSGWTKSGMKQGASDSLTPSGKLGGADDLNALIKKLNNEKIKSYASVSFQQVLNPSVFYSKKNNLVKRLGKIYSVSGKTELTTEKLDKTSSSVFSLNPLRFTDVAERFLKTSRKYSLDAVCAEDLGNNLYSDFSKNGYFTRDDAIQETQGALEDLAQDGKAMISGGNIYAVKNSDYIKNMPIGGNEFKNISKEVPFYQMTVHGFINYSGKPWNHVDDSRVYILKCVEYGASPYYQWSYRDSSVLKSTNFSEYYLLGYKDTFNQAVDEYSKINTFFNKISAWVLTNHYCAANGVYITEYDNNTAVVVNYNQYPVVYNGISVNGYDWAVLQQE